MWNGPDSLTAHSLIGWEDIMFLFDEGGLGARDLVAMNKACVLRHIWNIVSNKKGLWVEWTKNRRLKGRDFWSLKIPSLCTWSWQAILKGRVDAAFMVRHTIGDEHSTRLRLDPWQHRGILEE